MIPLSDASPRPDRTPYVNVTFIVINVVVFVVMLTLSELDRNIWFLKYGVVPESLTAPEIFQLRVDSVAASYGYDISAPISTWVTLVTSQFLHGGFAHILGNMVFLWVFGDNLEDYFGHVGYALFYLTCGAAAAGAHVLFNWDDLTPVVGASGAIAGVMGGYLLLYPRRRIRTLVMAGIITVIELPAVALLAFWAVLQVFSGLGSLGNTAAGGVAYWAHVGGFIAGAGIIAVMVLAGRRPRPQPDGNRRDRFEYDDTDDSDGDWRPPPSYWRR